MKREYDFDAAFGRIQEIVGVSTQWAVASGLGVQQASVSSAVIRKSIQPSWLIALVVKHSINPEYVTLWG